MIKRWLRMSEEGTFMWAIEQMKQGKEVKRKNSIQLLGKHNSFLLG